MGGTVHSGKGGGCVPVSVSLLEIFLTFPVCGPGRGEAAREGGETAAFVEASGSGAGGVVVEGGEGEEATPLIVVFTVSTGRSMPETKDEGMVG